MDELLGPHNEIVDEILARLTAIQDGNVAIPRIVLLVGESGPEQRAGGHEKCPQTVMGSARHDDVCLAAICG